MDKQSKQQPEEDLVQNQPKIFQTPAWKASKPFVLGGISSCFATSIIQPIDTIKVRIQVVAESIANGRGEGLSTNPFKIARDVIKNDGARGLYKGLDAALLRQLTYGTTRLGLFKKLSEMHRTKHQRNPNVYEKMVFSTISGITGCLVGNPADVALVRFQRDSLLPVDQRRNYKNVGDALARIVREEGVLAMWRGSIPTAFRAVSISIGQLTTYDEIKERINAYTGSKRSRNSTKAIAAFSAGILCSVMSLPFDNAKTKLQGMRANPDGIFPYKNVVDCISKTIAKEGVLGLWIGLPTYIFRVSPHAMITLLVQDWLYRKVSTRKVVY